MQMDLTWKLAGSQLSSRHRPTRVCSASQFNCRTTQETDRRHVNYQSLLWKSLLDHTKRRGEVSISTHNYKLICRVLIRIIYKMNGNVYICSLFLPVIIPALRPRHRAIRNATPARLALEAPLDDAHLVQRLQRLQVSGLTPAGRFLLARGEILDLNHIIGMPNSLEEFLDVQPSMWGIANDTVVEVEPVHLENGSLSCPGGEGLVLGSGRIVLHGRMLAKKQPLI